MGSDRGAADGGGEAGSRSAERKVTAAAPAGRRRRSIVPWALAAVVLAEAAALAVVVVRDRWQAAAEAGPVQRGERVAQRMGCFGCHGPGGSGGIPDPDSRAGDVPTWVGGSWTMYNHDPGDVRDWILYGHPAGQRPDGGALIKMPAYRGRMSAADLADLTVYVLTVSQFGDPTDPKVAAGRDVALRFGCFGCHGAEGRGLIADPGSLKGYVPAWDGADYADLVRSDAELRQWVQKGAADRLRANPAARHFLDGEVIQMPAFGDRIKPPELDALAAYVRWVRQHPRRAPRT
ncbi:MAG TPA: c-type cytochrome [Thermoanaerobaculia bacterium]|nr:c-type cytochrome [Thermoanaerobaculia bacterium]